MKTFEEKFNAWLDGLLSGEELKSFENEHPSLHQDKAEFLKLKDLLRDNLGCRKLGNPDFFNSQIMAQVERETCQGWSLILACSVCLALRWLAFSPYAWDLRCSFP